MTDGNIASPDPASSFATPYSALKVQMKEAGHLERQPLYYLSKLLLLKFFVFGHAAILAGTLFSCKYKTLLNSYKNERE